jgi:hypothetical protein
MALLAFRQTSPLRWSFYLGLPIAEYPASVRISLSSSTVIKPSSASDLKSSLEGASSFTRPELECHAIPSGV